MIGLPGVHPVPEGSKKVAGGGASRNHRRTPSGNPCAQEGREKCPRSRARDRRRSRSARFSRPSGAESWLRVSDVRWFRQAPPPATVSGPSGACRCICDGIRIADRSKGSEVAAMNEASGPPTPDRGTVKLEYGISKPGLRALRMGLRVLRTGLRALRTGLGALRMGLRALRMGLRTQEPEPFWERWERRTARSYGSYRNSRRALPQDL